MGVLKAACAAVTGVDFCARGQCGPLLLRGVTMMRPLHRNVQL